MKKMSLISATTMLLATGAHAADSMGGSTAAFGEPGDAAKVSRTVTIAANEMSLVPDKVEIKAGETVRFTVTNKGKKVHGFILGNTVYLDQHAKMMAQMPGMVMNEPNAIDLKPGETKSVVWRFTKTGSFAFACSVPGHADAGMEGEIAVR